MEHDHDNYLAGNATPLMKQWSNGNNGRCVICDLKSESNRQIKFLHIYARIDGHRRLYEVIARLLGFEVDSEPKLVCKDCYKKIMVLVKVYKKLSRLLDDTTPELINSP